MFTFFKPKNHVTRTGKIFISILLVLFSVSTANSAPLKVQCRLIMIGREKATIQKGRWAEGYKACEQTLRDAKFGSLMFGDKNRFGIETKIGQNYDFTLLLNPTKNFEIPEPNDENSKSSK